MPEFTQEQYINAFNSAPKDIKEVLFSDYTSAAVKNAAQRYNIDEDRVMDMSALIGYVLVGLVPIKKFISTLQNEAGLEAGTAKKVAYEIREQVFAPVAKTLAQMQENILASPETGQVGPASPAGGQAPPRPASPAGRDESVIRKMPE